MLRTILGKIHDKWGTINLVDELSKEIEVLSNDISNMPYIELIIKPLTLLLKYNFLIYQNKNLESMPDGDLPFKKYINLNIAKSLRLNWEKFLQPGGKKDDLFGKPILLKTFTDIKDAKSIGAKLSGYDPANPTRGRDWDIEVIDTRGGRDLGSKIFFPQTFASFSEPNFGLEFADRCKNLENQANYSGNFSESDKSTLPFISPNRWERFAEVTSGICGPPPPAARYPRTLYSLTTLLRQNFPRVFTQ